ncbi:MAG: hypothetical protein M3O72_00880 [Verrucomicrobiota bacterium]|nr:hypothetical protein [Verrucomicrobiota bacterium]
MKSFHFFVRANKNDPVFLDRDCFGVRQFFVNGVNISVKEEKIDILGGVYLENGAAEQCQNANERNPRFHLTLPRSFDVISFANSPLFCIGNIGRLAGIHMISNREFSLADAGPIYTVLASPGTSKQPQTLQRLNEAHPKFNSDSFLDGLPSRSPERSKSLLKHSPPSRCFGVAAFVVRCAPSEGWRLCRARQGVC